jgi:hypothetical protein
LLGKTSSFPSQFLRILSISIVIVNIPPSDSGTLSQEQLAKSPLWWKLMGASGKSGGGFSLRALEWGGMIEQGAGRVPGEGLNRFRGKDYGFSKDS